MPTDSISPPPDHTNLTVWFARVAVPANRWIDHRWEVVGLTPGPAAMIAGSEGWVARECPPLQLHGDEAEGYLLNVEATDPSLFLLVRSAEDSGEVAADTTPPTVTAITASFHEAARWIDGGATVERLPLPADWVAVIGAFGRTHLKPMEEKHPKRRYANRGDVHERPGH